VKPSVISVKININEKVAKDDSSSNNDDSPFQPGSPMERFFKRFGGPDGLPPGLGRGPAAAVARRRVRVPASSSRPTAMP